jgi:hypothetical protein
LNSSRYSLLRDWLALIIVFVAVPLSVFGGRNVACVGQGIGSACTLDAVWLSPLLLVATGAVAGLITRGWTGLFVVGVGQIGGQVVIVVLSSLAGRPVPIDLFSGAIATIWFGAPIALGYGLVRGGTFVWRMANRGGGTKDAPKDVREG